MSIALPCGRCKTAAREGVGGFAQIHTVVLVSCRFAEVTSAPGFLKEAFETALA